MTNVAALSSCNSLRQLHDTAKKLISQNQLDMTFEPKRANAFAMPVKLMFVADGDCIRTQLDAEAVRGFADAYKAGEFVEPISVKTEAGQMRVVSGFQRYAGLMLAISEGADIATVWVNEVTGGRQEELFRQVVSSRTVHHTDIELAQAFTELHVDFKLSVSEISARVHRSPKFVADRIALMTAAPQVVEMVAKGKATPKAAIVAMDNCKAAGLDVVEHLQTELSKAEAKGQKKLTAANTAATPLIPRKHIDAAMPALLELADKLEAAMPGSGHNKKVSVLLEIDGDVESILSALLKIREANRTANQAQANQLQFA